MRNVMEKFKVKAIVERAKDGSYTISAGPAKGMKYMVMGEGATLEEAKADFYRVYEGMRDLVYKREGVLQEAEFEFEDDTVSNLRYWSQFVKLSAISKLSGINVGQLSHYMSERNTPRVETQNKIKRALAQLGYGLISLQPRQ